MQEEIVLKAEIKLGSLSSYLQPRQRICGLLSHVASFSHPKHVADVLLAELYLCYGVI